MKKEGWFQSIKKFAEQKLKTSSEKSKTNEPEKENQEDISDYQVRNEMIPIQDREAVGLRSELEKAKDKYSVLYDFAPIGYTTLDREGVVLEANLTLSSMLGIDRFRMMSRPFFVFIVPDYWDIFQFHRQKVFSSKKKESCELKMRGKDNREIFVQIDTIALKDKDQNYTQCLNAVIDISSRKEVEERYDYAYREINHLFNISLYGLLFVDTDMKVIRVNDTFAKSIKTKSEIVVDKNCRDIMPFELYRAISNCLSSIKMGKNKVEMDIEWNAQNREVYNIVGIAYRGLKDELLGMFVELEDITERKRYEKILSDERNLFNITLENIADGVIVLDRTDSIIFINNSAERFTSTPVEKAIGLKFDLLLNDLDSTGSLASVFHQTDKNYYRKNRFEKELTVNHPGGETLVFWVIGSPMIESSGRYYGEVLVMREITGKKRSEQEFLKTQKIESLFRLAGGIGNEFNNALTPVLGGVGLLRRELRDSPQFSDILYTTEHAVLKAKELTNQLLSFTAGSEPSLKLLKLPKLIEESVNYALTGYPLKPIYNIPEDLSPVEADEALLIQVFHNIAQFIREKDGKKGELIVRAGVIGVEASRQCSLKDGRYIEIVFEKLGRPINSEELNHIFDPYYENKRGLGGLALTMAYKIVQQHSGTIEADSLENAGYTIRVYLPVSDKKIPLIAVESISELKGSGRILLMDDEEAVRKVGALLLHSLGYECDTAIDGEEAVRMYASAMKNGTKYDAVILDLIVPDGMNGREAIGEMKKIDPKVKSALSTGYSTDNVIADYREWGFCETIVKPYTIEQLGAAIKKTLA